ncbi:MAG: hypothetical protein AB1635_14560 [Acidobacteriota bacterium]
MGATGVASRVLAVDHLRVESHRHLVMVVLGLLLVPSAWFAQADVALYSGDWPRLLPRFLTRAVLVLTCVGGIVAMRQVRAIEAYSRAVWIVASLLAATIVALNLQRPEGSTLPMRTPLFILLLLFAGLPNRLWRQIGPPLAMTMGLIALRATWLTDPIDLTSDVLMLIVANAVGVMVVLKRLSLENAVADSWRAEHDALVRAEQALAELRTLRGIIPICSYCKRVRSEVGDWQQIERYVRDHSAAEFSHGICPSCVEEQRFGADDGQPATNAGQ